VWHDDQQGTATVVYGALLGALEVVGKSLSEVRIAMIGMGAANVATYRLLRSAGLEPAQVVACDSKGTLHPGREDIARRQDEFVDKWQVCTTTNPDGVVGGIAEALRGADVCIAFSSPGPGTIHADWVAAMATDAIVFACANPVPEIWPADAKAAGARVVATGRGDFPNQVNNSLVFPAIFRGVLDVRASRITDGMARAAARELARCAADAGIGPDAIVPTMADWEIYPRIAAAAAAAAHEEGVATVWPGHAAVLAQARATIAGARAATETLMASGVIRTMPGRRDALPLDAAPSA
jgi:malate dehydrogenase (oxaloacetate-decarboxylating)